MFGKGKTQRSVNDQFIMDAGRRAGNLRAPPKKADKVVGVAAVQNKAGLKGRTNIGTLGHAKVTPPVRGQK